MFLLIANRKESDKNMSPKKKIKSSRSSSLFYFLSFFYGKKTKPQTMAKSQKGSQTGAGQGREGLDIAHVYHL